MRGFSNEVPDGRSGNGHPSVQGYILFDSDSSRHVAYHCLPAYGKSGYDHCL